MTRQKKGMQVLLVDDNEMVRQALTLFLEDEGIAVTSCASGSHALALSKKRAFAAYVVDYRLAGMRGDAVTAELRRMHPYALIVGCSIEPKEQAFLAAGADMFLLKENLHIDLAAAIRTRLSPK